MSKKIVILLLSLFGMQLYAQTYEEYTEQALRYVEKDSLQQAIVAFEKALESDPTNQRNSLLFSNMGTVQRKLGKTTDAIKSYTYALNIAPKAIPILLNRATVYFETNQFDHAFIDYSTVLDKDPNNAEALLMRAYIYMTKEEFAAAKDDYERLLELDPNNLSAVLGYATLHQKEKKTASCDRNYE